MVPRPLHTARLRIVLLPAGGPPSELGDGAGLSCRHCGVSNRTPGNRGQSTGPWELGVGGTPAE